MLMLRILIMAWVFLAGVVRTGLVGPNRSSIEAAYGLTHSQFGLGIALIQIVCAGGVLLAAPRLRRYRPMRLIMAGLGVQVAGFMLVCATASIEGLAAGWAIITIGLVLGSVVQNVSMDLWVDNPRKGVVLLHSFNAGGKVAGPAVTAMCLTNGWRSSFAAVGIINLVILAAFCLSPRRPEHVYRRGPREGGDMGLGILRKPLYWLCVLPFGMIAGGEAAFATLMPSYFEKVGGMSPEKASLLLTVHLLGLMAGRFATAYAGARASNKKIIGVCLGAGVFVFPAILIEQWFIRCASLFLLGVMFSSTWPTFYAQVSGFFRDHREMLAYGSSLGNYLGISLCIVLSSVIADYDLRLSLFVGPVVLWLFGVLYYLTCLCRGPGSRAGP